jgi:hypothetical protein
MFLYTCLAYHFSTDVILNLLSLSLCLATGDEINLEDDCILGYWAV